MTANFGGTNIIQPLMAIFGEKPKAGIPRQIFLLTDGEVTNTQECIDAVRNNADTTRVFTFGIGDEASVALVQGMAEAGEGKPEFIRSGDPMEEKVMRQLHRALKPAFTDIKMDWGDVADGQLLQQTPYRFPPLFAGGRIIIFGFMPAGAKAGKVTLTAETAKGQFKTEVEIDPSKAAPGQLLHRLAARSLIRDVQDKRSYLHDEKGKLQAKYKESDVRAEIVSISTRTGIVSPYTAFVAVEKRKEATQGDMQVRKIEIQKQQAQQSPQPNKPGGAPTWGGARGGGGGGRGGARGRGGAPTTSLPASRTATATGATKTSGFLGGLLSSFSRSSAPAPAAPPSDASERSHGKAPRQALASHKKKESASPRAKKAFDSADWDISNSKKAKPTASAAPIVLAANESTQLPDVDDFEQDKSASSGSEDEENDEVVVDDTKKGNKKQDKGPGEGRRRQRSSSSGEADGELAAALAVSLAEHKEKEKEKDSKPPKLPPSLSTSASSSTPTPASAPASSGSVDSLRAIIRQQNANGSWTIECLVLFCSCS